MNLYETNIVRQSKVNITIERTIEMRQIENTEFAWYEDYRYIMNNSYDTPEFEGIKRITGITSIENIKNTVRLDDIDDKFDAPRMKGGQAVIAMITQKDLDDVQQCRLDIDDAIQSSHSIDISQLLSDDNLIVIWNSESQIIADLNFKFIPLPIHFSYHQGYVTNKYYDLTGLLNQVKRDNHVCQNDVHIWDIPYQYSTLKEHSYISFDYLLSQEDYNEHYDYTTEHMRDYILTEKLHADDFRC